MTRFVAGVYEFDDFRLDAKKRTLRLRQEPVSLTPKAFEMLLVMVRSGGVVLTKEELIKAVWPNSFVEDSNLTQAVFVLRKVLRETPDQRYILTVQGTGYRFAADVKEISEKPPSGTKAPSAISAHQAPVPEMASERREGSAATQADSHGSRKRGFLFAGALAIVMIAALTTYPRWSRGRDQARVSGGRMMLAVLPFQNLTGDAGQDYFSDGLTEEIIAELGNREPRRLGVIARTSVMHYKNSQAGLDQVGRELGVQYVLEGSVRLDSGKVRITAQLIQIQDQSHLWAGRYDRELLHTLALQGDVAQQIAGEIQLTLEKNEVTVSRSQPRPAPRSYEAYDLYLKGRYFLNKRTTEGFRDAIKYFEQAIAKDPGYARAYAGLADCYALLPGYSSAPPTEFLPRARAAALQAVRLDEGLAEAHTSLALIIEIYDWDWQSAENEYRRAIELNPNYATAHHWYAEYLAWQGRFDEALAESELARELDPLSLIIATDNGMILYYSRQYDRAEKKLNAVLEMEPNFPRAHRVRSVYVEKGEFAKALADIKKYSPHDTPWDLAYVFGRAGRTAEARRALEKLEQLKQQRSIDPAVIAWAFVGMGSRDETFVWLEKAFAQHSSSLATLKVEPAWDALRSDPRFEDLLHRVGLTP